MRKQILIFVLLGCFAWNIQAKVLDQDITNATASGTVAGNAKQITMVFSSDFTGTVKGVSMTWAAGGSMTWNANQTGDILAPMVYTITTGTIHILRVQ